MIHAVVNPARQHLYEQARERRPRETGNAEALRSKYKLYNHDLDSRSHECGCIDRKDRGFTPSSLDLILKVFLPARLSPGSG